LCAATIHPLDCSRDNYSDVAPNFYPAAMGVWSSVMV
jgi:hypothetical protein